MFRARESVKSTVTVASLVAVPAMGGGETRTGLTASEAQATMYVWGGEGFDSVDGVLDPTSLPAPVCVDCRTTRTGIWLCVSTFWVSLPSNKARRPPLPCDAMTMRSQFRCAATLIIASYG